MAVEAAWLVSSATLRNKARGRAGMAETSLDHGAIPARPNGDWSSSRSIGASAEQSNWQASHGTMTLERRRKGRAAGVLMLKVAQPPYLVAPGTHGVFHSLRGERTS